jgi:hypothetical protein
MVSSRELRSGSGLPVDFVALHECQDSSIPRSDSSTINKKVIQNPTYRVDLPARGRPELVEGKTSKEQNVGFHKLSQRIGMLPKLVRSDSLIKG